MSAQAQNPVAPPVFEIPRQVQEFGQDGGKFYRCYDALAEEIDEDMVKGLKEQLDGMLIFAGLFAGVNSAFLALTLPLLSPDTADDISALLAQNNAILIQVLTGRNDTVPTTPPLPSAGFSPSSDIFAINALFSLSMAFAIISSFLAVLGRQWLVYYRKRSGGGPEKQRWEQLKRFLGAERWQLEPILDDVLPSLLQIGLIIFCVSLILYLRHLSPTISVIVGIPMYIGLAFFIGSAFCTVWDKFCPFHSPLSHVLIWSARTIPPTLRAIITLQWRQLSMGFSLKHWLRVLFHGRKEETSKSLQIIALQRAIRTSDDPETLLHATANIFGITEASQIDQLWNDISFRERFLDQCQHAHSRMLQLRGQNQVNIATASQRLYSAAAAHMILSHNMEWEVPDSFRGLIDALGKTSLLIPGSQSPDSLTTHIPPFTILRLLYNCSLSDQFDNNINGFYSYIQTCYVDATSGDWRVVSIVCSFISHLCDAGVGSGVNRTPADSLIKFTWGAGDNLECLRTTLDMLVAPGATGPLDRNALLVGVLRCVNQSMLDSGHISYNFSWLEDCERIMRSSQLSGAARQVIRNIRIDLSKSWLKKCSENYVYRSYIRSLKQYMAEIQAIYPGESGYHERIDMLWAFSPSMRQVIASSSNKWKYMAMEERFALIKTFNNFVQELDRTSRQIENNTRRLRDPDERWCHWEERTALISPVYSIPPDPPGSDWAQVYASLEADYGLEGLGLDDVYPGLNQCSVSQSSLPPSS